MRSILPFVALAAAAVACNSSASGTIQIVTGEETDTFSRDPKPTQLEIDALDTSCNKSQLATATLPTDTVDLGNQDETAVGTLLVSGRDASNDTVVYGQSVAVEYGALDGYSLPVFVQRVNELARMPSPPSDSRAAPTMGILSGRFLVIGAGSDASQATTTQVYDFAQLTALSSPPSLSRAPMSMPLVGTVALVIDGNGADYYDFSQNATVSDVSPPSGFAFGDVAGGATIYDPSDGVVFVVGATRTTGAPTAAVLKIDTNDTSNSSYVSGNLSWLTLSAPRLGASAAWIDGVGLVVAGGSATAAGMEIVGPNSTTGTAHAYAPDPATGGGMTVLGDKTSVLVAGGVTPDGKDAGVRKYDTTCSTMCAPAVWTTLPVPLTSAAAFTLASDAVFMVGSETGSGLTHAYQLADGMAPTEIPTRVPHTNAAAALSPLGSVVLFGGAPEIEAFMPWPLIPSSCH